MKILRIQNYLPDTAKDEDHPKAVDMKTALDDRVKEKEATITLFEVSEGVATVGASTDDALKHIEENLKDLPDVEIRVLSQLQAQLERNRADQARIDQKRETKAKKHAAKTAK